MSADDIVAKLLEQNPTQRYASAADHLADLEAFIASQRAHTVGGAIGTAVAAWPEPDTVREARRVAARGRAAVRA